MTNQSQKSFGSLRQLITESAELYGDKAMYIYRRGKIDLSFSYNDGIRAFNAIGAAFAKIGLLGKTVAVIGDTDPYYVMTYYATVSGNGVIVPLDKEISKDEIFNFLNISGAEAVENIPAAEEGSDYLKIFTQEITTGADLPFGSEHIMEVSEKCLKLQALADKNR